MTLSTTVYRSPIGPLTLVASEKGLCGLYFDQARHQIERGAQVDDAPFHHVVAQLDDYFAGRRERFEVELDLVGTEFQRSVWRALLLIPYGETMSYGELARHLGKPKAMRAVGLANGRNPVAVIVPCHRVIGADGSLTGFGGGLARKRFLLELEQRDFCLSADRTAMPLSRALA